MNGEPISRVNVKHTVIKPVLQDVLLSEVDPQLLSLQTITMVSDSSDTRAFVFECDKLRIVQEFPFSLTEAGQSSSMRELLAVHRLCMHREDFLKLHSGCQLLWLTDSMVMQWFLTRGSRIPAVQKIILDIKEKERLFNFIITPHWLPRTNVLLDTADYGSKRSSNEWGLDYNTFKDITKILHFNPDLDALACDEIHKCSKFFSKIPSPNALANDFFLQPLYPQVNYYLCPDVKQIIPVLNRLFCFKDINALFVVPLWRTAAYWPSFMDLEKFKSFIVRYHIFKANFISLSDKNVFHNDANFKMIAFVINTSK